MQAEDLLQFVVGNDTLMQHLHVDFHRLQGKMKMLASQMESGIIHPGNSNPVFQLVHDGLGMHLGRLKDMLERTKRPHVFGRLRLGGESPN